ncbi:unnamed protein product [Rhizopus stolonifer]
MKNHILFAFLLQLLTAYTVAQIAHQSQTTTAPIIFSTSIPSYINGISRAGPTPTNLNASAIPVYFHNTTISINGSALSSYYSPSPTTFIFTHYPTHTNDLNTSTVSSMMPSQSAPLPDDTIGKNGRLRISNTSPQLYASWAFILILLVALLFLQS